MIGAVDAPHLILPMQVCCALERTRHNGGLPTREWSCWQGWAAQQIREYSGPLHWTSTLGRSSKRVCRIVVQCTFSWAGKQPRLACAAPAASPVCSMLDLLLKRSYTVLFAHLYNALQLLYLSHADLEAIRCLERGSRQGGVAVVAQFACQTGCKRRKLLAHFSEAR